MADRIEGFTFFASYLDAAELLPDEADRAAFIMAVCRYGLTGEDPELSGTPAAMFALARPTLDCSRAKVIAGRKGGKAERKQTASKPEADNKQDESNVEPIKDKGIGLRIQDKDMGKKPRHFVPPSVDEVRAYCLEEGIHVDPESFVDYFESVGWIVGNGKKMKSWKAAVRNWEKRDKDTNAKKSNRADNFNSRDNDVLENQNKIIKQQYEAYLAEKAEAEVM